MHHHNENTPYVYRSNKSFFLLLFIFFGCQGNKTKKKKEKRNKKHVNFKVCVTKPSAISGTISRPHSFALDFIESFCWNFDLIFFLHFTGNFSYIPQQLGATLGHHLLSL